MGNRCPAVGDRAGAASHPCRHVRAALTGFNGNDTLLGGDGNDTLFGGFGADSMVGGSDTFHYGAVTDGGDRITDFTTGVGGDKLDVANLLTGFTATSDPNAFVRCVSSGANTIVQIDANGAVGGATFTSMCTLAGVTTTTDALVSGGNLMVE
ncbi:MAG: type I secretion C-terminal target domain-containing protein [Dongiaceae bacterium]